MALSLVYNYLDFLNGVGLRQVEDVAQVMTIRSKVMEILKSAKLTKSNLTINEEIALQQLKSDTSIKILKVDDGNSTVVMDSSTYDSKVKNLLTNDSFYKQLPDKSNPLNPVVQMTNKLVWQQRKNNKISQSEYFDFQSNKGVMPIKFTVSPKYTKLICTLSPIVPFMNSSSNNLSQLLCKSVSPLSPVEPGRDFLKMGKFSQHAYR